MMAPSPRRRPGLASVPLQGVPSSKPGWTFRASRREVNALGRRLAAGQMDADDEQLFEDFVAYCDSALGVVSERLRLAGFEVVRD